MIIGVTIGVPNLTVFVLLLVHFAMPRYPEIVKRSVTSIAVTLFKISSLAHYRSTLHLWPIEFFNSLSAARSNSNASVASPINFTVNEVWFTKFIVNNTSLPPMIHSLASFLSMFISFFLLLRLKVNPNYCVDNSECSNRHTHCNHHLIIFTSIICKC